MRNGEGRFGQVIWFRPTEQNALAAFLLALGTSTPLFRDFAAPRKSAYARTLGSIALLPHRTSGMVIARRCCGLFEADPTFVTSSDI